MRTLIVYVSIHGNTARIAKAIGKVLDAQLIEPEAVDETSLAEYDLIGFGSGIYFERPHARLRQFVARLPRMHRKAFIFSTRGGGPVWFYHRGLKKRLIAKGFCVVGEFSALTLDFLAPFRHIGGLKGGNLNERNLEKARAFAASLKSTMTDAT